MSDVVAVTSTLSVTVWRPRVASTTVSWPSCTFACRVTVLHAGEHEGNRVVAGRQRQETILAVDVGRRHARRRQHAGARFDGHAGQHPPPESTTLPLTTPVCWAKAGTA